jgi:hypothetical protein
MAMQGQHLRNLANKLVSNGPGSVSDRLPFWDISPPYFQLLERTYDQAKWKDTNVYAYGFKVVKQC